MNPLAQESMGAGNLGVQTGGYRPRSHGIRAQNQTWKQRQKIPSCGSKNHHFGQCRPCKDFATDKGCKDGAKCNFCHFEHHEVGKYHELALHASIKQLGKVLIELADEEHQIHCSGSDAPNSEQLHVGQALTVSAEEDHQTHCNGVEAPYDESWAALWSGSPPHSMEYSELDPSELTHWSEDPWQLPCGGGGEFQQEVPEATRTALWLGSSQFTEYSQSDLSQLTHWSRDPWQQLYGGGGELQKQVPEATCPELWPGSCPQSHELSVQEKTQEDYFESDPSELPYLSEDRWQLTYGGGVELQEEVPEATCPSLWLGSSPESTEYSESDPSELTNCSEDPWQLPGGGSGKLQKEAPEATCTTSSQYGNESTDLKVSWDVVLGSKPEVQSLSI